MSNYTLLHNVLRVHRLLAGAPENQPLTVPSAARRLGISDKQVGRCLNFLKKLGYPLRYEGAMHRWRYVSQGDGFRFAPAVCAALVPRLERIPKTDVALLFMLSEGWEALRGTSLFGEVKSFFNTLGEDRFRVLSAQVQEIFSHRRRTVHPRDGRAFERLMEAVYERTQIRFWHHVGGEEAEEERVLDPHHLTCWDGMWFVIGMDPWRKAMCTVAVNRIRQVQPTGIVFAPVDLSVIRGELRDAFGVMGRRNGSVPLHRVRLRFSPAAALRVRERRWHDSQTDAVLLEDGGVEISFELADLAEVQEWVLSWGEHVRVLAPQALVGQVHLRLEAAVSQYANGQGKEA
jgi:predicted DNA-binding transcriptional regulator YafY